MIERIHVCIFSQVNVNRNDLKYTEGEGGGYSQTLPIWVCAAQRGRDFEAPDLERGYPFQGRFLERGILFRTHESSSLIL